MFCVGTRFDAAARLSESESRAVGDALQVPAATTSRAIGSLATPRNASGSAAVPREPTSPKRQPSLSMAEAAADGVTTAHRTFLCRFSCFHCRFSCFHCRFSCFHCRFSCFQCLTVLEMVVASDRHQESRRGRCGRESPPFLALPLHFRQRLMPLLAVLQLPPGRSACKQPRPAGSKHRYSYLASRPFFPAGHSATASALVASNSQTLKLAICTLIRIADQDRSTLTIDH